MNKDEQVAELLVTFYESGADKDPEELIRAHPDLADDLRAQLHAMNAVDAVLTSTLPAGVPDRIGDYKILREVGRGGMGVVYEAEQTTMQRRVALKVLSLSFTSTPQAVKRFRREAQAAGRLHHTNIVPVYALGQHDGYWYYAMELVTGRPLNDVIRELKHAERPGEETLARLVAESAPDGTTTPVTGTGARAYYARIAEMFAGVAEALDLAHREEIVHRDIKPSNLLFAADGALKIVDFGLARTADQGPSLTITGDLLGTPLYMSPEQAMAKRVTVDHRTDIYSLGATLYEVITLRAPFEGETLQAICSQIISKDPVLPRKRNDKIPRDLETIVLKAIDKDRDKRYQSAGEMARDLRRFALGEPIRARRIGIAGRSWRKIKRHRGISTLIAATVVLAVAGGVLATHAAHEAALRKTVEYDLLLGEAEEAMAAQRPFAEPDAPLPGEFARDILTRAVELVPDRPDAYWLRALAAGRTGPERWADLEVAGENGLPRRTLLITRARLLESERKWEEADAERVAAQAEKPTAESDYFEGRILHTGGQPAEALRHLDRAIKGTRRGDHIRFLSYRLRARVHEDLKDFPAALKDLHTVQELGHDSVGIGVRIASLWRSLDNDNVAERRFKKLLRGAAREHAVGKWMELCVASRPHLDWHGRATEKAIAMFPGDDLLTRERGLYLKKAGEFEAAAKLLRAGLKRSPEDHGMRAELSRVLLDMDKDDEALASFNRSLKTNPECTYCLHGRALVHFRMKRHDREIADWRAAIRAEPRRPELHYNLGVTLQALGRHEEAEQEYRQAIRVDASHGSAYVNLTNLLWQLGRHEEALPIIERGVELDPDDAERHLNHGNVLLALDRLDDAEAAFRRAVELSPDFGLGLNNLGGLLLNNRDDPQAALPLFERAAALAPEDPLPRFNAGLALCKLRRHTDARPWLEKALALQEDYPDCHTQLGASLYYGFKEVDKALTHYNRAIELDPTDADPHHQRGIVLADAKQDFAAALRDFRKALEIDPKKAQAQRNIGICLRALGKDAEALAAFEKAVVLNPRDGYTFHQIARMHLKRNDHEAALAAYDRGLQHNPGDARLHNFKGTLLNDQLGRHEEALVEFEAALKAEPDQWSRHFNMAIALNGVGRHDDAVAALDQAIKVEPRASRASYLKGEILLGLGRYAEARGAYEQTAKLNPRWAQPWLALMHLTHEAGMYTEGAKIGRAAVARFKNDIFLRAQLVACLVADGTLDEAKRRAAQWSAGPIPKNRVSMFAYLCAIAGDGDKARAAMAKIAKPDQETLYYYARVHAVIGDDAAALRCLKQSAKGGYKRLPQSHHHPEFARLGEAAHASLDEIGGRR